MMSERLKIIGYGHFAVVALGYDKEKRANVAIKKISDPFQEEHQAMQLIREVKFLRQAQHFNILGLKDLMRTSPIINSHEHLEDLKYNLSKGIPDPFEKIYLV